LLEATGVEEKALITFSGYPMLHFVLSAFLSAPSTGRPIVVVGNRDKILRQMSLPPEVMLVQEAGSMMDNLYTGLSHLQPSEKVLLSSCDIPLITGEMIEDFLGRCREAEVDVYYPIIEKSLVMKRFPMSQRTFVRLRDGIFTGGNVLLVNPAKLREIEPVVREVIRLRKSPFRLASRLGFLFLLRLLTGGIRIAEVERKAEKLFGIRARAVRMPYPEIGTDLDKTADLFLFQGLISRGVSHKA